MVSRRDFLKGVLATTVACLYMGSPNPVLACCGDKGEKKGNFLKLYEGDELLGYVGRFRSGNSKLVEKFLKPDFADVEDGVTELTKSGKCLEKLLGLGDNETIEVENDRVKTPSYGVPNCATLFVPQKCGKEGLCEVRVANVNSGAGSFENLVSLFKEENPKKDNVWVFSSVKVDPKSYVTDFEEKAINLYFKENLSDDDLAQFGLNSFGMITGRYLDGLVILQNIKADGDELRKYVADIAFLTPFALYVYNKNIPAKVRFLNIMEAKANTAGYDLKVCDSSGGLVGDFLKVEGLSKTVLKMCPVVGPAYEALTGDTDAVGYDVDKVKKWYKKCKDYFKGVKKGDDYVKAYLQFVSKHVLYGKLINKNNKERR